MKKLFFIIPIIFFLNVEELKVISYNIRYDNSNDGINVWENRKSTITKFLVDENPDFAGLQEVTFSQLSFLIESLKNYSFIGVGREDGKTKGEYSPIFYNNKKYKVISNKTFWLSSTPKKVSVGWDASMERICTYGLFENLSSKEKVWVFNTHFDHLGITARVKSAKLILDRISKLNIKGQPVIITGDFNLTPDTIPIQTLHSVFQDVLSNIKLNDSKYGTFNGFDTSKNAIRRIDYIFQKGFNVIESKHLWIKTSENLWASDHHPVYLKCSF